VVLTLAGYTVIYLVMAVAWFKLMKLYAAKGADQSEPIPNEFDDSDESKPLSFAY
jgi:cytochrome bd-type quinol oxidase subunit 1